MEKSTRKNLISTLITILILTAGFFVFQMLAAQKKSTVSDTVTKNDRRKVVLSTFSPEDASNAIEVDGRLSAHERVSITSKVQGIMQSGTSVKQGKYFKKGDLLYSIDNREANFNLKAQKSSLMTAITQMMPDIKFDFPQSFDSWQKYLKEFDVDKPVKALPLPSNDQEKYFVSGRNLENQYYQIKSLETRLSDYNIYAPFSGVVTSANAYAGALISPGQELCKMINTSYYEIQAPITLQDLKYVKTGQKVKLRSDELGKEWIGKVNRISTQIDATTQNLPLFITVNGSGLKDGMYLKGSLQGSMLEDVIKLPKNIFLSPNSIFVVKDSTVITKTIEPIKRGTDYVFVKGLGTDEYVITGSLAGIFDGQKVTY